MPPGIASITVEAQHTKNMTLIGTLFRSSLGRKYVMGVTGLLLFLFVVIHILGNLQIFLGPVSINEYAVSLKSRPWLLWPMRIGLLVIALLHITTAIQLALENREARPVKYATGTPIASTYAARTIVISGLIILAFVLFHLGHFTLGFVDRDLLTLEDAMGRHDVYRMMVTGFSNPFVSGFYIVSMLLLSLHLSHGLTSAFQSIGLRSQRTLRGLQLVAAFAVTLIFLASCMIPIAVLSGLIN